MSPAIKARLKEPSTYAGLAVLFLLGGKTVSPELAAQGAGIIIDCFAGLSAIVAAIVKEFKE